jgi:hypothetical protein
MVAPCYFLACRIFEDAGFVGRLRAVPEDEEGIDVEYLETEIVKISKSRPTGKVSLHFQFQSQLLYCLAILFWTGEK